MALKCHVSASFGVTISDGSERIPDVFVRVADEALYRAKAAAEIAFARLYSLEIDSQPGVGLRCYTVSRARP